MLVDGFGDEFLCPVCRDRAMVHMLGDLQVTHIMPRFGALVSGTAVR